MSDHHQATNWKFEGKHTLHHSGKGFKIMSCEKFVTPPKAGSTRPGVILDFHWLQATADFEVGEVFAEVPVLWKPHSSGGIDGAAAYNLINGRQDYLYNLRPRLFHDDLALEDATEWLNSKKISTFKNAEAMAMVSQNLSLSEGFAFLGHFSSYLNHSHAPNCKRQLNKKNGIPEPISVIATEKIQNGAVLSMAYRQIVSCGCPPCWQSHTAPRN